MTHALYDDLHSCRCCCTALSTPRKRVDRTSYTCSRQTDNSCSDLLLYM